MYDGTEMCPDLPVGFVLILYSASLASARMFETYART
jgi:hypothetical protein